MKSVGFVALEDRFLEEGPPLGCFSCSSQDCRIRFLEEKAVSGVMMKLVSREGS